MFIIMLLVKSVAKMASCFQNAISVNEYNVLPLMETYVSYRKM